MPRIAPSRRITAAQLQQLEERMQAYYAAVPDYRAFHAPSHHPLEWRQVLADVNSRAPTEQDPVSILEFGSGRSGFPAWLSNQLVSVAPEKAVHVTCQDVTAANVAHLEQVARCGADRPAAGGCAASGQLRHHLQHPLFRARGPA
jgi:hypothetical protein